MMSLNEIKSLADKVAIKAAQERRQPYTPFDEDEVREYGQKPIPFPNLGTYRPAGWKMVDRYFVDKTGYGYESEPALTLRAFRTKLLDSIKTGKDYGYGIVEEGPCQLYVGVFERTLKVVK